MYETESDIQGEWRQKGAPAPKILVPVVTPYAKGIFEEESFQTHIDDLFVRGVHSVLVLTEVGEREKLRPEVKKDIIDAAYDARRASKWERVLVNTTGKNLEETVNLTEYAIMAGATTVVIEPLAIQLRYSSAHPYRLPQHHSDVDRLWKRIPTEGVEILLHTDICLSHAQLIRPSWIGEWIKNAPIRGVYAGILDTQYVEDLQVIGEASRSRGKPFEIYVSENRGNDVIGVEEIAPFVEGIGAPLANVIPEFFLEWASFPDEARWHKILAYTEDFVDRIAAMQPQSLNLRDRLVMLLKQELKKQGRFSSDELC